MTLPPVFPLQQGSTRRIYSLTSLCLLSHHPFQSNLVKCLAALKHLVDACDFALLGDLNFSHTVTFLDPKSKKLVICNT